ncbi:SAM-dependent methyltransferase [Actinoplanes utahensis]|uniref:SAM-dependent methyltransferase n=1 Tax=Actinoplanes utahensis TaxID=1869 RepID=UPI00068DE179|nr:methyltransferase domain-containing protein [Actinoplanes utahensis]GIF32416.1 methyltransferase type 11 [Actinoplanes utahensis]
MSVDYKVPTPESVGAFYDRANTVIAHVQGGNMHYGYWTGPDDDSDYETAGARLTDLMIERVDARPGDRVLDVGCGPGRPGVRLARTSGAGVLGISVSEQDVRLANERAAAEGLAGRVGFQVADMLDLPFAADTFDHAMALESIVHVPDRVRALSEISRVVRPGGRVVLTDFTVRSVPGGRTGETFAGVLDSWRAAEPVRVEDYQGFAEQAGLVIDEILDITDNTKYTGLWTYLELRRYARENAVPAEVQQIIDAVPMPDVSDEQLVAGWKKLLDGEQMQGVIIVRAHVA